MDSRTVKIAESPQNEMTIEPLIRDAISLQIRWPVTLHRKNTISDLSLCHPVARIVYWYRPRFVNDTYANKLENFSYYVPRLMIYYARAVSFLILLHYKHMISDLLIY